MTTTNDALREWAEIAGVSIGAADGGPYPTIEQLAQFAALAQQAAPEAEKPDPLKKLTRLTEDMGLYPQQQAQTPCGSCKKGENK